LAQIAVGKGTLLVLASGWNPGDSQLAVSSKFPPFMQTLLDWSGSVVPAQYQFSTGDRIPSPTSEKVEWLKPDGKKESTAGGKSFEATDVPGIYTATFEGKSRKYAVNVPLDESKTTALSPDQLAGMGVPMKFTAEVAASTITQDPQTLQNSELEKRQKIWRWVILGVLVLTIAEVFLSGWLIRRPRTVEAIA
ncbi:MAG: N-terminal double-transrane protein, partial [Verrucomicrobiales bacterium]|nr:N-terminal double-transrane protein [Verrucomicrobiales bacterium]